MADDNKQGIDNRMIVDTIETRDGDRWLSKTQVCKRTGISQETIRVLEINGKFPRRLFLSPVCVRWSERELNAWMAEKMETRESSRAKYANLKKFDSK